MFLPPLSPTAAHVHVHTQVQLQAKTAVARTALGTDWVVVHDGPATATTFAALMPGCAYLARVAARNQAGCGQFCMPLLLTAASDVPLAPETPQAAEPEGGGVDVLPSTVRYIMSHHTTSDVVATVTAHSVHCGGGRAGYKCSAP